MNNTPLNVLIIEDSEEDTDLLLLELRRGGFSPSHRRVDNAKDMLEALDERQWDLVLSDYSMPRFTMPAAMSMVQEKGLDVPFLIVSATIGEDAAVEAMRTGAHDYILKHRMGRLVPAVRRELRECAVRRERRALEEQLRQAQKLESLGLLAGGVAHDFNNLLTGILGNASIALEAWSPPEPARAMLEDVVLAAERAADLTRQLLAYAGRGVFVIEPVDMAKTVREIAELIRSSLSRKVELVLDFDPDLPPVEGDASQIQQLVMNLVLNGAEAIGDRYGLVQVKLRVDAADASEFVTLLIEDNGCGMDEATTKRIFDPFFTTKFTGRGLGLAAVQGIVRSHHGEISVESVPGRGSMFKVSFPASLRKFEPQLPVLRTMRAADRLSGSRVVLVADDEPLVRRTALNALRRYGYTAIEAENGEQVLRLVREMRREISLVLLDLTMPVMGGEETFPLLHQMCPDLPVLISSGFDEAEAESRFAGQGIAGFIKKPYTGRDLAAAVARGMDGQAVNAKAS